MDVPNFERAEYLEPQAVVGEVTAAEPPPIEDKLAFGRAIAYGAGAAVLGSLIYALVGLWIQIGYVAILVGGMVGTGMMNGSRGVGGRRYQVASVLLTYFAVSLAGVLDMLWEVGRRGDDVAAYLPHHIVLLVALLIAGPFIYLLGSLGGGLLGLLILFFGMQAAWRITKGGSGYIHLPRYNPDRPLDLR